MSTLEIDVGDIRPVSVAFTADELVANLSAGFDRASFAHDVKTVYAATKCLEISYIILRP
jgi:hypothetical protein